MTDPNNTFTTSEGRIVGGSISRKQDKSYDGGQLAKPVWVLKVAFPKTDQQANAFIERLKVTAKTGWAADAKQLLRNDFAWKFIDGDSSIVNQKGVAWNSKEGYPGHNVVTFQTHFDFETVDADYQPIDPATVKTGFYVRVAGTLVGSNGNSQNPGIYVNLGNVMFVRAGEEIRLGGMSAREAFGDTPTQAPPAHDVVTNAVAPTPPPPPSIGPELTPAGIAAGVNVEAYLAAKWTLEQLAQKGYIEG